MLWKPVLWKKALAPVLLTAALATTAVSAVSAAGAPTPATDLEAQAAPAQGAPAPSRPRITDPAVACAISPAPHAALPPLCGLWLPKTLPADQQEAIGRIIVRVANAAIHRPALKARLVEWCERYLASHPDDTTSLRARLCRRIVAGETLTPEELRGLREAAPTTRAAPDGQRRLRPALQGAPGATRPRPAATATPIN